MHASIRWRLTGWYVAALTVTLILLGAAVLALMQAELYDWLDDSLRDRAASLASAVHVTADRVWMDAPVSPAGEEAGNGYVLLAPSRAVVQFQNIDPAPFVRSPAVTTALRGRTGSDTVTWGAEWRVVSYPVMAGHRTAAMVLVPRDLGELHQVMGRLLLVLLGLLPVALIGAGLGGMALAGRVLQPVDEITRTAAEISEKDLSRRLPVRTRDELGRLAATFNSLIGRLETAFERQRRFSADASHELRTPLAVIRAITSQKLMQARTTEDYRRSPTVISTMR